LSAGEAARFGEVVVVSVPFGRYRELPSEGVAGKVVIDTNNYHPQRDGHFEELDRDRTTSSELLQAHLAGARVVKAFNAILWARLRDDGRPAGGELKMESPYSRLLSFCSVARIFGFAESFAADRTYAQATLGYVPRYVPRK
jgi:predicted dinucleotide-binding enzyme